MNLTQKRPRGGLIALPDGICTANGVGGLRCPQRMSNWFEFKNVADDAVDIFIYDEIVDTFEAEFFGIGISAAGFVDQLQELAGKTLNVHINSPGGLVFGGIAIYNALQQHDGVVNTFDDGIAASIASVIFLAGDTRTMAPHSMLMIHEAQGITVGPRDEHMKQAEILGKLDDNIASIYAERGEGTRAQWRAKMAAETWFSDKEAVSAGLADGIQKPASAPTNTFDLSHFKNAPAALVDANATPTKREIEQTLRDAGLSSRVAKAFVSAGWTALETRDESEDEPEIEQSSIEPMVDESPAAPTGTVDEAIVDLAVLRSERQEFEALYSLIGSRQQA